MVQKKVSLLVILCLGFSIHADILSPVRASGAFLAQYAEPLQYGVAALQQGLLLGGEDQKIRFGVDAQRILGDECEYAPRELRDQIRTIAQSYGVENAHLINMYQLKSLPWRIKSPGIVATNGDIYIDQNGPIKWDSPLGQFFMHDAVLQIKQSLFTKKVLTGLGVGTISSVIAWRLVKGSVYTPLSYLGLNPLSETAGWLSFGTNLTLMVGCAAVSGAISSWVVNGVWNKYAAYALAQRIKEMEGVGLSAVKKDLTALMPQLHRDPRKVLFEGYLAVL